MCQVLHGLVYIVDIIIIASSCEEHLHAAELGQQQILSFVTHRLTPSDTEPIISLNEPLEKSRALAFQSLYEVPISLNYKEKQTVLRPIEISSCG